QLRPLLSTAAAPHTRNLPVSPASQSANREVTWSYGQIGPDEKSSSHIDSAWAVYWPRQALIVRCAPPHHCHARSERPRPIVPAARAGSWSLAALAGRLAGLLPWRSERLGE